jgi:hypothetical protein
MASALDLAFRARESCQRLNKRFRPRHVQIFSQMFAAEERPMERCMEYLHSTLRPQMITITFRYTDWWWWEYNQPLRMRDWPLGVHFPSSVQKLVMQFETRNGKRQELDRILNDTILKWKIPLRPELVHSSPRTLITKQPTARTYEWVGSDLATRPIARHAQHAQSQNGTTGLQEGQMLYYVAVVEWKNQPVEIEIEI